MTGLQNFRHSAGQLSNIVFAAEPNQYRGLFGEGVEPYLEDLDRTISYTTTGKIAGMIIEPVQGYGGIIPMPAGYIPGAFERVRAAGGVCIVDEVQSGFGKTGEHMWGFQSDGVVPDIVVMAKGIGNGIPLGAVVARKEIAESMSEKYLFHTYGANPVACAAGRAVLKVIEEEDLIANAKRVGAILKNRLLELMGKYEIIGDVRGKGFMLAIELVKDRRTRKPAADETAFVFERSRVHGLVMSKSGNFKNVLRMVPPLCLSEDDVKPVIGALEKSFDDLVNHGH